MTRRWLCGAAVAGVTGFAWGQTTPLPVTELGLLPGDTNISLAVNSQQEQSIDGGNGVFLLAWTDYRGQSVGGGTNQSGSDLFGLRLDGAGVPLDASPFMIAGGMGTQARPHVAWNGQDFLVLYESQDPVGGYFETRMRAVRVSAAGEILDPTPISFPATQFEPSTIGLQASGQNGQWLVTRCIYHNSGYGTYLAGQRIDSNGVLLDQTPLVLNDWVYGATRTLIANDEYLVVGPDWSNSATIKARRVGQDGVPIGASFSVPSMNLASNGSEYYVVWVRNYTTTVGSRMTSTGTLLTPNGTTIGQSLPVASLTHDGTQWWILTAVSDQLHTIRINAAGNVLDPNGGVLLPIVIGGSVNTAYGATIVPQTGGGVQAIWNDLRIALNQDTNIFGLPVSAANVPGTERGLSTGTRTQRTPDFADGPNGQKAIVFVSEAASDETVLMYLLNADGTPLHDEPIVVAHSTAIGKAGVAWNGSEYMVTWDESATVPIKARRLDANGAFIDQTPIDVMTGFSPDVEALGGNFLIASSRVDTYPEFIFAQARRIDGATGIPLDASPLFLGGGYVSTGPRVHSDGARWIVVYHSHWSHDSSQSDALYNFVNSDGTFTAAQNPVTYSGSAGTPDVAFSGNKYLFVWRNNSLANANNYIAGRIMNLDGSFATAVFTIAEATGRQLRPVASWDGTQFVVAYDDQRNQQSFFDERTDVYGTRVSETGTVLDPNGFPIYVGPEGDATTAIVSDPAGFSLVASARFQTTAAHDSYRVGITLLGDVPNPPKPGDTDNDGDVDLSDLGVVLAAFGLCDGDAGFAPAADLDGSGCVELSDLGILLANFGL